MKILLEQAGDFRAAEFLLANDEGSTGTAAVEIIEIQARGTEVWQKIKGRIHKYSLLENIVN